MANSDSVWRAMAGSPVRFFLSGWPMRSIGYLLGTVVIAPFIWFGLLFPPGFVLVGLLVGAVERRRLRWFEAIPAPSAHTAAPVDGRVWLRRRLREAATWREFGYSLCFGSVLLLIDVVALGGLFICGLLLAVPVFIAVGDPFRTDLRLGTLKVDAVGEGLLFALVVAAPATAIVVYTLSVLAGAQATFARWLLTPTERELRRQLAELATSRTRLVNAFEAERRRIERDLHDGAQQHLVLLSMNLGLAELELGAGQPRVRELLTRAHQQARQALTAIRDQIHGIHPQVLTDFGMPAAVEELAERAGLPVEVDINLAQRLPPPIESTAYFVVSEALTNAVRHASCTRIAVTGSIEGEVLRLVITDDGIGGADVRDGTGLRGLMDRAAVMDGTLVIDSPTGGPTTLRLELPCPCA